MLLYETISSDNFKYLAYIVGESNRLIREYLDFFTPSRENNLDLLLNENFYFFKVEVDKELKEIQDRVNGINIFKIDTTELESIAKELDILISYFKYGCEKIKENEKVNN